MARVGLCSLLFVAPWMGGCDPKSPAAPPGASAMSAPRMDERNLAFKTLEPFAESNAVRAALAKSGVEVPELRVLMRRDGRALPGFRVNADEALNMWERLRAATDATGWYPLIFRDAYGHTDASEDANAEVVADTLRAADECDPDRWFEIRRSDFDADERPMPRKPGAKGDAPKGFHVTHPGPKGEGAEDLFMVLVPTKDPCAVPAHIAFGGWNECPDPHVQVAMLRRWNRAYGVEPVTCGGDVLELRAAKRPGTLGEALQLAEEQFLYCNDIVDQGLDSIDALADTLMRSSIWFFWWD